MVSAFNRETGFVYVPNEQNEVEMYIRRMSEVSVLPPSKWNKGEIDLLRTISTAAGRTEEAKNLRGLLRMKYFAPDGTNFTIDKGQQFCQAAEGYYEFPLIHGSYGIMAPSYLEALESFKVKYSNSEQSTSLLLGGMTTDCIREFVALTSAVFPGIECSVLDIDWGSRKARSEEFATCIQGDALGSPLPSHSFDTIQTNQLLSQLESSAYPGKSPEFLRAMLFREAKRMLKPGGALILAETLSANALTEGLKQEGFGDVDIAPMKLFTSRRACDRYFMGSSTRYNPSDTIVSPNSRVGIITAYA